MSDSVEVWKVIDNYPNYEVSDRGRVRSTFGSGRLLKLQKHPQGYLFTCLYDGKGVRKQFLVHRLVLLVYNGDPRNDQTDTRHLNGVKTDNRLENLAWGTRCENMRDQLDHGTRNRGEKNGQAKLTRKQVKEIVALLGECSDSKLAGKYRVSKAAIYKIRKGIKWSHVTGIKQ